jgi:hypothetical protein
MQKKEWKEGRSITSVEKRNRKRMLEGRPGHTCRIKKVRTEVTRAENKNVRKEVRTTRAEKRNGKKQRSDHKCRKEESRKEMPGHTCRIEG